MSNTAVYSREEGNAVSILGCSRRERSSTLSSLLGIYKDYKHSSRYTNSIDTYFLNGYTTVPSISYYYNRID